MKLNTKSIEKVISKVFADLAKEPSRFVSETDIHFWTMHNLLNEIPQLKRLFPTGCSKGGTKGNYKTLLIHKEYGNNDSERKKGRSDIIIFDDKDVQSIIDPINLKNKDEKYLTPNWIFEFGTEKSGTVSMTKLREELDSDKTIDELLNSENDLEKSSRKTLFWKHLEQDYKKVSEAKEKGYVINIFRNYSKTQNEINFQRVKFCEIVATKFVQCHCNSNKVGFLLLTVNLGSDKKRVDYKVRLLAKNGNHYEFFTISQSKLEKHFVSHLSGLIPIIREKRGARKRVKKVISDWK